MPGAAQSALARRTRTLCQRRGQSGVLDVEHRSLWEGSAPHPTAGRSMVITLRLPRSSALKLNLAVGDIDRHEVVTTLTAVELAGRLSLTTGKAFSPEAVVRYGVAWRSAIE